MSFGEAIKSVFKKYGTFDGRSRRSEFWWWYLFTFLLQIVLSIPLGIIMVVALADAVDWTTYQPGDEIDTDAISWVPFAIAAIITIVVGLLLLLPSLAVGARRLHDMGQSGHWLWLMLIGLGIVPLIMCILESQPGDNKWGPNPKGEQAVEPSYPGYPPAGGTPPQPGYPQ